MREINLRKVKEDTKFEKNILYKIDRDMIVPVIVEHEQDRDIVNLYCSLKDGAMITAIKGVRDFIEQLNDENLHKTSFLIYYQADGYEEDVKFGIATRSFEANKFLAVADFL